MHTTPRSLETAAKVAVFPDESAVVGADVAGAGVVGGGVVGEFVGESVQRPPALQHHPCYNIAYQHGVVGLPTGPIVKARIQAGIRPLCTMGATGSPSPTSSFEGVRAIVLVSRAKLLAPSDG